MADGLDVRDGRDKVIEERAETLGFFGWEPQPTNIASRTDSDGVAWLGRECLNGGGGREGWGGRESGH